MPRPGTRGRLATAGTNSGAFGGPEWSLLVAVTAIWGSSFLWIAIALDHVEPGMVAFVRIALGAAALWCLPATHKRIPREDWPLILVVAVAGNAGPAVFLAWGQQHVDSAVAGMLNGSTPLFVVLVAWMATRVVPGRVQLVGLAIGLVGVVCMAVPNVVGASATPLGVGLVLATMLGYGVANLAVLDISQRHGGVAVVARAQLVSAFMLVPFLATGIDGSTFDWRAVGALLMLGVFSTGLARAMHANLIGRAGAARASIVTYLIPVVAVTLGVAIRGESVGWWELTGTALVLVGAYFTTRAEKTGSQKTGTEKTGTADK